MKIKFYESRSEIIGRLRPQARGLGKVVFPRGFSPKAGETWEVVLVEERDTVAFAHGISLVTDATRLVEAIASRLSSFCANTGRFRPDGSRREKYADGNPRAAGYFLLNYWEEVYLPVANEAEGFTLTGISGGHPYAASSQEAFDKLIDASDRLALSLEARLEEV